VPFDIAFSLDEATLFGWSVIMSEFESGQDFDPVTMKFKERKPKK
jgi:hypothetical protein